MNHSKGFLVYPFPNIVVPKKSIVSKERVRSKTTCSMKPKGEYKIRTLHVVFLVQGLVINM